VISRNPKISRRFHLPLQSGSDRILKRMKRLHTYEEYKAKIDRMRELISDIAVTTDIITGFSRETEEDHILTRQALQEIRYDSAFIYKYSLRPGTPAAKLPDDVPQAVKEQRHRELLELQKEITDDCNHKRIGKAVNAFVEGKNPRNASEMIGRTDQDKKVVFKGGNHLKGSFARVMIMDLKRETFIGDLCG
ncbi:MAG TPA: radical SAM protein, partial [bacterium]|nr:radical SAM protein [bacterium]